MTVFFNPVTARVCSDHFHEKDYIRDLKAEVLGCTPKKVLKEDDVEPLNLLRLKSEIISDGQKSHIDSSKTHSHFITPQYHSSIISREERYSKQVVRKRVLQKIDVTSKKKKRNVDVAANTDIYSDCSQCLSMKENMKLNEAKVKTLSLQLKSVEHQLMILKKKGTFYLKKKK